MATARKPKRRTRRGKKGLAGALETMSRATVQAGTWVAAQASAAFHAIDPDVRQYLSDLPLLATTLIGPRRRAIHPRPDDGHRVLVCVHGMGGHPQNFLALRGYFALAGRRRVYAVSYDDDDDLELSALGLAGIVEEILRVNELPEDAKVDLFAHSMGGIVARLALFEPDFASRVNLLITAGTPHLGTHAARFLATPRSMDLRPESPVMKKLATQAPWPGPPKLPKLIAFYSRADVLMLPATTATLAGADNRELEGISHSGYLIRPRALARIKDALDEV